MRPPRRTPPPCRFRALAWIVGAAALAGASFWAADMRVGKLLYEWTALLAQDALAAQRYPPGYGHPHLGVD